MNPNKQQTVMLGGFLIVIGLVIWLNLWWLVWPGVLVGAGVLAYRQRRRLGRPVEAVQAGLWCFGLALLFLTHFWLGVLFLAGLSLLLRGRELQVDAAVQQLISQARSRPAAPRPITSQQVPISTQPPAAPPVGTYEDPATGNTTRLRE
jgi:hypothetical protein